MQRVRLSVFAKPSAVFLFSLLLHILVGWLTPFVPEGGWDGSVYLDYIQQLAHGESVSGDPYRLVRMSGFLPAILAVYLGMDPAALQFFQAACNAVLLSAAAALLLHALLAVNARPLSALLSVAAMVLSWPFLVLPQYYPMLSDHLALVLATASIWAWALQRQKLLYLLVFIAVWVMPGLFVAPLALAALPRHKAVVCGAPTVSWPICKRFILALLMAPVVYVAFRLFQLTPEEIREHPVNFAVGLPQLKVLTLALTILLLLAVARVHAKLLASATLWRSIDPQGLTLGLLTVVAGIAAVFLLLDWESGFQGPPLFDFMLLQASAAPLKPLVAHFVYFGPIFLVAFLLVVRAAPQGLPAVAFPLYALFAAYLPLLVLGSESRQWIAAFPVAAALVALGTTSIRVSQFLVALSLALCVPVVLLGPGFQHAQDAHYFTGFHGQLYFGRQGPWMAWEVWLIGLALMFLFLFGLLWLRGHDSRAAQ